jgi:hypothetical protein
VVVKNALAAQNTTALEGLCLSLVKNVPLRIKVLRDLREEFDVLALPLLNALDQTQCVFCSTHKQCRRAW